MKKTLSVILVALLLLSVAVTASAGCGEIPLANGEYTVWNITDGIPAGRLSVTTTPVAFHCEELVEIEYKLTPISEPCYPTEAVPHCTIAGPKPPCQIAQPTPPKPPCKPDEITTKVMELKSWARKYVGDIKERLCATKAKYSYVGSKCVHAKTGRRITRLTFHCIENGENICIFQCLHRQGGKVYYTTDYRIEPDCDGSYYDEDWIVARGVDELVEYLNNLSDVEDL